MLFDRMPEIPVLRWLPATTAALLWAGVAGGMALWWLHFPRNSLTADTDVSVTPTAPAGQGAPFVMRALGHTQATAVTPEVQRRFQLLGLIAADSGAGSALLAVDGQPAQAFVQGQTVLEGWRLQSVGREGVSLSSSGATLELKLPERP